MKAAEQGRLLKPRGSIRRGAAVSASRGEARRAWQGIAAALAKSGDAGDRKLAEAIDRFSRDMVPTSERFHAEPAQNQRPTPAPEDRSR